MAFLDIAPANKGHSLVIPKQHYEVFTEIPDEIISRIMKVIKDLTKKIENNIKPDGYNIINNNRKAAEQLVPHAHFHIIPRLNSDNQRITWKPGSYEEGEIDKFRKQILG